MGMQRNGSARLRWQMSLIVVGTLLLLALGVLGNWPWLATEHARLEPLHQVCIWAADGTALLWMLWFGLWHCLIGKPVPAEPATDRSFRWVLLTLLAGMAVDVTVTVASAYQEEVGNRRGLVAPQANLIGGRTSLNGEYAYVTCRFQDQAGAWHESRLDLHLEGHPPALDAAVRGGQFPIPVQIKYDPAWPPRCWLHPQNVGEHQPLYALSLCVLLFQGILVAAVVVPLWKQRSRAGFIPTYKFVPVWGVMLPLCCAALGKLLIGEL